MQYVLLIVVGLIAGSVVSLQNIINSTLGRYVGTLGAVLVVAIIGALLVIAAALIVPGQVTLGGLPGPGRWYLYLGGLMGVLIVAIPVFLVPRIGATATITAIVVGQLTMALIADQFGLLGTPRIEISLSRLAGVLLLAAGAFLVVRR
jgi:bacterial/archaeal transporter family-2 protein